MEAIEEHDIIAEEKSLLRDDLVDAHRTKTLPARSLAWPCLLSVSVAINVFLLITTVVLVLVDSPSATVLLRNKESPSGDDSELSSYLFPNVDLSRHSHQLNGRIHDNTSIFRQDPSADVDSAWTRLSAKGYEIVTVDRLSVSQSGKNPDLSVKAPPNWGFGSDTYIAQVDVFHQIHCLNELRKEIHFDYYYGKDARLNGTSKPRDHVEHKKHCLHILLQNVMCHADLDIITHNWVHYDLKDQPTRPFAEPLADFNVVKKCRDFEALLGWAHENAVKDLDRKWRDLKMPPGAQFVQGDGYF